MGHRVEWECSNRLSLQLNHYRRAGLSGDFNSVNRAASNELSLEGRVQLPFGPQCSRHHRIVNTSSCQLPVNDVCFKVSRKRALTLVTQKGNAIPEPPPSVFLGGSTGRSSSNFASSSPCGEYPMPLPPRGYSPLGYE